MKLKYVTLTGADDSVNPEDLLKLSKVYPFVEWAILFSQSKAGVARYPSLNWVEKLCDLQLSLDVKDRMKLSAHLCGKWVEEGFSGKFNFFNDPRLDNVFRRVQLNMGKDRLRKAVVAKFVEACKLMQQQVIWGGNYEKVEIHPEWLEYHDIFPLFDASGGRGIGAKEWPKIPTTEFGPLFCGYAGGLGPDNVVEECQRIAEVVGDSDIWIDMESSLRGPNNEFSLEKCENVLKIIQHSNYI